MYFMGKELFFIATTLFVMSSVFRMLPWKQSTCTHSDVKAYNISMQHHLVDKDVTKTDTYINLAKHPVLLKQDGLDLFIHTAFLDERFPETIVRVLGMQRKHDALDGWKCTLHTGNQSFSTTAKRTLIDPSWPWWGHHYAVSFDCHFLRALIPQEITLYSPDRVFVYNISVERTLRAETRKPLAVCVKPARGRVSATRLVEWFETLKLAGIAHFIIYDLDVSGPAKFVLQYYKHAGNLQVVDFPFSEATVQNIHYSGFTPGKQDAVFQQTYIVGMVDCLYRFQGTYEHILYLDLDEILLPVRNESLVDVIRELRRVRPNGAGFLFHTSWHFSDHAEVLDEKVPKHLYMQRHLVGTFPGQNQPKSIVVTDKAISVNFHSILDVPERKYSNEIVSWQDYGYVYHFRTGKCLDKFYEDTCGDMMSNIRVDPILPRYLNDVSHNVALVINHLSIN